MDEDEGPAPTFIHIGHAPAEDLRQVPLIFVGWVDHRTAKYASNSQWR
jgi:hypothetical protein